MLLALFLVIFGVLTRFMPHAANFSPVLAIALFGGVYLRRSQALWVPLLLMVISDIFIGLHSTIPFTWGSVLLASCIGLWVRREPAPGRILVGSVVSAVLFFFITNFGAWLAFYPMTREGLAACYTLAIPFFRMTLMSTLVYSAVLFLAHGLLARGVERTRWSTVLLSK